MAVLYFCHFCYLFERKIGVRIETDSVSNAKANSAPLILLTFNALTGYRIIYMSSFMNVNATEYFESLKCGLPIRFV